MSSPITLKIAALGFMVLSSCAALGPAPVLLGAAGNYAILAKAAVSTVPTSIITGDIGISPASSTFLTGFALTQSPLAVFSTSSQVVGALYAADYTSPTPSILTTAVSNMETAYTDASTRANPDATNLAAGDLSGITLRPGLYKWTSGVVVRTSITVSGSNLDTWIFQISGTLNTASNIQIILSGGALAQNIVWVVTGAVAIGSGGHFEGVLLGATGVTLNTGATMNGRILAQTAVSLQKATVSRPV